jgi:hypothetical protein
MVPLILSVRHSSTTAVTLVLCLPLLLYLLSQSIGLWDTREELGAGKDDASSEDHDTERDTNLWR